MYPNATECSDGFECGVEDDGCGGTIDCETCSGEDTCEENVCVPPVCIPMPQNVQMGLNAV